MIDKCCSCGSNRIGGYVNQACVWCMLDYTLFAPYSLQKEWDAKCARELEDEKRAQRMKGYSMVDTDVKLLVE